MDQESQQSPPAVAECPPLEELACLVDGVLSRQSAETTLGHILACPKCYEIYVGLLRFQLAGLGEISKQKGGKILPLPQRRPPVESSGGTNILRNHWRPSVAARRVGPIAVLLQRLISRDGFTFDEACEALHTRHGVKASREKLEEIHSRILPRRTARPKAAGSDQLASPGRELSPEEALIAQKDESRQVEVLSLLREAFRSLPDDEQLILRLQFNNRLSLAFIARIRKLDPKALREERDKSLRVVHEYLRDRGVREAEIDSLLPVSDDGDGADSGSD